ncbi:hypothetical protein BLL37_00095 [Pseudomonas azotoformans]|uniref:Abortive infection protein-like C-terminal domain-containing protein n=1 Tax=Pseudomonas azotoformans TaxID=47878 RepID=A0A1V2JRI5_PSEAZ|nr:hypothetical protein [Pseudomonas azotoformans]OIN44571.1 hypothetical protein BFL39_25905 [Pseudomonas azotoformans]ONH47790.1 hypothetical protein BLL37_00095 [Pseudomonas azotoformans]SDN99033.1 hypothetical protein SAMN04489799_3384 [Pseudomonas azotoformans]
MPIINLFSKRMAEERDGATDVYTYDRFSDNFRVQLSLMIQEILGDVHVAYRETIPRDVYASIVTILRKEYGVEYLVSSVYCDTPFEELHRFLRKEPNVERILDAVELGYRLGHRYARKQNYSAAHRYDAESHVDACIEELNGRFKEAGYGYEFVVESESVIRIDSEFVHAEVVKPAIHFLSYPGFEAARSEFFGAYEHYRHERYKEALVDAGKAFESTCKIICKANDWPYAQRDTANKLILILIENGLMPSYNQTFLTSLQSVLASGIPTLRNNLGGHGDGHEILEVSPEIVAYGLHLTASAIMMLAALQEKREAS